MAGLLDWLNPLNTITGALKDAYLAKVNAANDKDRIEAEVTISHLEALRDATIASSKDPWWSPRVVMGWAVAAYVVKLVFWDTVLGWGVTPDPGPQVTWIVMTVVGFYFLSKGAENVAGKIASALLRRR